MRLLYTHTVLMAILCKPEIGRDRRGIPASVEWCLLSKRWHFSPEQRDKAVDIW